MIPDSGFQITARIEIRDLEFKVLMEKQHE